MVTRAELLRAHRFVRRRLVGAVDSADPEASPSRWFRALACGVAVVVIGVGVIDARQLTDKPPAWRDGHAIIVERETNAEFIYVDGVLHPMTNYLSARLALGLAAPRVVAVAASDLRHAPMGARWGIPGAPDVAPQPSDLVATWAACSDDRGNGHLALGEPVGGYPLNGLLVTDRHGDTYQIVDGQRAKVDRPGPQTAAADAFVSAIPVVSRVRAVTPPHAQSPVCAIFDGGAIHVVGGANAPGVRVAMAPGWAALVRSSDPSSPTVLIVEGVAYSAKDAAVLAALGLAGVVPLALPPAALSLVPHGVELDEVAARTSVGG